MKSGCMRTIRFALHFLCFLFFTIQMIIITHQQLHPFTTVARMQEKRLNQIEHPVLFKICFKPSFDTEELIKTGYGSTWNYMAGISMYNRSIFGWGGHTKDGTRIGSVEGEKFILQKSLNKP